MFRFTIRDVLWLTVVVAIALGWAWDHRRLSANTNSKAVMAKLLTNQQLEIERMEAQLLKLEATP